jgi:hypothetical protein
MRRGAHHHVESILPAPFNQRLNPVMLHCLEEGMAPGAGRTQ